MEFQFTDGFVDGELNCCKIKSTAEINGSILQSEICERAYHRY